MHDAAPGTIAPRWCRIKRVCPDDEDEAVVPKQGSFDVHPPLTVPFATAAIIGVERLL